MSSTFEAEELWRQIPPEEKIALLNRAHGIGAFSALVVILVGGTMAVGLMIPWFLWGAMIAAPLVFQISAGRAWRSFRPTIMLEYLAARSAARRFAFTAKAKELAIKLIFRGKLEEVFDDDHIHEELEAAIAKTKETAVWVALFDDAVVMLSEAPGGAVANFAQIISDKLTIESNAEGDTDYSNGREVLLAYDQKPFGKRRVRVTSQYPAAMIVFEKTLQQRMALHRERKKLELAVPAAAIASESSEDNY